MRTDYHHLRPGLVAKIDYSINLLRKAESLALKYNPTDGFYLAFSGGKDSQCLYHVAQLAGVKFKAHFSPTSVDPPQLIMFIKRNYPDVEFVKIKNSIYKIALKRKCLPTMTVRWCCSEFKEMAGAGNVTLIGIRHAESVRRAKRNEVEITRHKFSGNYDEFLNFQEAEIRKKYKNLNHDQFSIDKETEVKCISGKDSILVSPIINWSDRDVWDFLNGMDIEHCELYDNGHHRIGCILCPMSSLKSKLRDIEEFPHVKEKWIKTIIELTRINKYERLKKRKDGLVKIDLRNHDLFTGNIGNETELEMAENIFDWWISGKAYSEWYADKFLQFKINFGNEETSN